MIPARAAAALLLIGALACASGSGPTGSAPDPGVDPTAESGDAAASGGISDPGKTGSDPGAKVGEHLEAGLEGMIVGTVIGGQVASIYGAAVGAALFGLYGLITGDVPLDGVSGPTRRNPRGMDPDSALEQEIEDELVKQDELEAQIEAELQRQEELLEAINRQETFNESFREEQERRIEAEMGDVLSAPRPPYERQIPESLFEVEPRKNGGGRVAKTLDANRDGKPEIELVFDEKTGELVSRAEDSDFDGELDAENRYENGQIRSRSEDTNHDGKPDRFTSYENGRGTRVEVDRDYDGRVDGFYIYERGTLAREEHDCRDAVMARVVQRRLRHRSRIAAAVVMLLGVAVTGVVATMPRGETAGGSHAAQPRDRSTVR